jgi:glucose-6-phosphate 1-dehydrogenase
MDKPKNCIIIIFGASGDLTKRKLVPSIFQLFKQNLLPDNFAVLGVSRADMNDESFRTSMSDGIKSFAEKCDEEQLNTFLKKLNYISLKTDSAEEYTILKKHLYKIDKDLNTGGNFIYYLATPTSMFGTIAEYLGKEDFADQSDGYKRIIVEKPFGYNLESAIELNKELLTIFKEDQIFRIDHYLGKETVQNILVTRFSNGIFEPLWNRNYIHHIEITAAESIGIENRGGYYDNAGAMIDMVQNHLLQLTGLIAMEPPSSFDSNAVRNETLKVFQSLRPLKEKDVEKHVIRGQYTDSKIRGEQIRGYREEKDVNPDSRTETFFAMKLYIDNWRWGGVPFYIRTGKRLPTHVTEVVINFKPTPHYLFSNEKVSQSCNQMVIRIQPDEGILLKMGMKVPGSGYKVQNVNMDFHYKELSDVHIPEAYERLLHDCMIGDSTLYARVDAVEAIWKFISPIQNSWADNPGIKVYGYPAGTWGPKNADDLIEGKNFTWRYPCKNLEGDGIYCEL